MAEPDHSDAAWATAEALARFPRRTLFDPPTPFHPLPRLSEDLGTEVWVKRDDLTGLGLGGNKVRKLEFLLGDARARGCDTVVTFGGLQSNHARQTAAACARLGLRCHLILSRSVARDDELYRDGGNVLLDELFGATLHRCAADDDAVGRTIVEVEAAVHAAGGVARWIPPGGSEPIGTLGYVAAGLELAHQAADAGVAVSDVVVATSTGGTQAGLLAGLAAAGWPPTVHGTAVYRPKAETAETVRSLVAGVDELLRRPPTTAAVDVIGDQLGGGYGVPTDAMRDAVHRFARLEGIVLDPVYSGKAAAALVKGCTTRRLGRDGAVVFVHTGGSPALFAYGRDALTG